VKAKTVLVPVKVSAMLFPLARFIEAVPLDTLAVCVPKPRVANVWSPVLLPERLVAARVPVNVLDAAPSRATPASKSQALVPLEISLRWVYAAVIASVVAALIVSDPARVRTMVLALVTVPDSSAMTSWYPAGTALAAGNVTTLDADMVPVWPR